MRTILGARLGRRAAAAIVLALVAAVTLVTIAPGADARRNHRRAKTARVEIDNFAYKPKTLRVNRGTTVVFVNRDSTTHTATRAGSFDTGRIRPGRRAAVRFRKRGVFVFHCTIHPFMRGKVVVR